jgi:hypothetical protein
VPSLGAYFSAPVLNSEKQEILSQTNKKPINLSKILADVVDQKLKPQKFQFTPAKSLILF